MVQPRSRVAPKAVGGVLAATAVLVLGCLGAAADPLALWRIVHDQCVVHEQANHDPKPCESVDLAQGEASGVAILKDRVGVAQLLAIPTRRIIGIESPELLADPAPNYWHAAWAARPILERTLGRALPRDAVAIAINSIQARSQNQLHLHIDCVAPDVHAALAAAAASASIEDAWAPLRLRPDGRAYQAKRILSADLADVDPFHLLAQRIAGTDATMGQETLVAVGATFADGVPGFILLSDRADPAEGDFAHGEDLLDHSCAVALTPVGRSGAAPAERQ